MTTQIAIDGLVAAPFVFGIVEAYIACGVTSIVMGATSIVQTAGAAYRLPVGATRRLPVGATCRLPVGATCRLPVGAAYVTS